MMRDVPRAGLYGGPFDVWALLAIGLFAYAVLVGDLWWRDLGSVFRISGAAIATGLVAVYVVRAPHDSDIIDRAILLSVLLFCVGAIASAFPRQSFDSALAVLLYAAALHWGRRVLARERVRQLFVATAMALSCLMAVLAAAQMVAPFLVWWALADWAVLPPLDLKVLPEPWVFRYEISLLLVMLYPSWWMGRPGRLRIVGAVFVGVLTTAVCMIAGSRSVWLAAAVGLAVISVSAIRRAIRTHPRLAGGILTVCVASAVGAWLSGIADVGVERLARAAPLEERVHIWSALFAAWADRPLTGTGPGSFPWVLQLTGYFDEHAVAPRHADNGLIQLLAESGVVGIIAGAAAAVAVLRALPKGRSKAATFSVVAFLTAMVGMNPAEYVFLMAAVIAWTAFGIPRAPPVHTLSTRPRLRPLAGVAVVAAFVIGIAFWATVIAGIGYSSARVAVGEGDLVKAERELRLAQSLDPGLALYPRQLGTLFLLRERPADAAIAVERAVSINPSDDLGWRVLGIARWEAGDREGAVSAVEAAVDLQRSDSTNLLLLARLRQLSGDEQGQRDLLVQALQAWPTLVAAPSWSESAEPWGTNDLLTAALERWRATEPSAEPLRSQPLLIALMLGLSDSELSSARSTLNAPMREALVTVTRCLPTAEVVLDEVPPSGQRLAEYWEMKIRQAELTGGDSTSSRRLFHIMTDDQIYYGWSSPTLNPLHEHGTRGSSPDTFGYRRAPMAWPSSAWELPSQRAGKALWHIRPMEALQTDGLEALREQCGDA